MRVIHGLSALAVCVILAACGGSSGYPTSNNNPPPSNNNPPPSNNGSGVTVGNNDFAPGSLSVTAGQTVTWTWDACTGNDPYTGQPGTCVTHGVTFDDGAHSDLQSQGTYSRTFAAKGSFAYHCPVHGAAMSGNITVQ
jgi:plastocyanin